MRRAAIFTALLVVSANCEPLTKPYIAYLTSPFDQDVKVLRVSASLTEQSPIRDTHDIHRINIGDADPGNTFDGGKCPAPVNFQVRYNRPTYQQSDMAVTSPPTLLHGTRGQASSLLVLRHEEILDFIHLDRGHSHDGYHNTYYHEDNAFPMLFQGSTFVNTSPLIMDCNGDGKEDAVIIDYDGRITIVGIYPDISAHTDEHEREGRHSNRFMKEIQIPHLAVRKDWVSMMLTLGLNESNPDRQKFELEIDAIDANPIHSYFVGNLNTGTGHDFAEDGEKEFRGSSADPLHQSHKVAEMLARRHSEVEQSAGGTDRVSDEIRENVDDQGEIKHRGSVHGRRLEEITEPGIESPDEFIRSHTERYYSQKGADDRKLENSIDKAAVPEEDFSKYYLYDDDAFMEFGEVPEDRMARYRFYSEDQYIHIPPHVTSSPTYFEVNSNPSASYENTSFDEYIAIAVSYYFDEDEYKYSDFGTQERDVNYLGGDISEAKRGQYVASALIIMNLRNPSEGKQVHLDLSTDSTAPLPPKSEMMLNGSSSADDLRFHENNYNNMGALALSSPTIADLDRDGNMEALVTTSMGFIHSINVPFGGQSFTAQMRAAIEHPAIAENVLGDANLEVIAMDVEGNIVCLDHGGKTLWYRSLLGDKEKLRTSSDLVYGGIKADGTMGVLFVTVITENAAKIFAIDAENGSNLPGFPIELVDPEDHKKLQSISNPLLLSSISSNLILQALRSRLYFIDTSTGCAQFSIYTHEISSIQLARLDGGSSLSIVGTLVSGEVFTLENPSDMVITEPDSRIGILVDENFRKLKNHIGTCIVPFSFQIIDENTRKGKEYHVEVRLGKSFEQIIFRKSYNETGKNADQLSLSVPSGHYRATIRLRTDNGKSYQDDFEIEFNADSVSYLLIFNYTSATPCDKFCITLHQENIGKAPLCPRRMTELNRSFSFRCLVGTFSLKLVVSLF